MTTTREQIEAAAKKHGEALREGGADERDYD